MKEKYSEFDRLFKAIGDVTRLKIVDMLSCGEKCACELLSGLNITQPTLSYHMKNLTEAGLVSVRKDGSWMRYSINEDKAKRLIAFLSAITSDKTNCICKDKNIEPGSKCE